MDLLRLLEREDEASSISRADTFGRLLGGAGNERSA